LLSVMSPNGIPSIEGNLCLDGEDLWLGKAHTRRRPLDGKGLVTANACVMQSEQLSPEEVIFLLNDYFSYMVRAIEQHHGLVYQFVGDGIMAVFGAPVKLADHADSSVQSALAMMDALDRFNVEVRSGLPPIRIGIGINTGPVVAGIIGTEQRMEYRVVGDSVNLAARIEALNKEFHTDVLISRATVDQLKERFPLKPFEPVKVKGKEDYVQVYAVTR